MPQKLQSLIDNDPKGLKPVIRLISAIVCSFSGATALGTICVKFILDSEPMVAKYVRYFSSVVFVISIFWCIKLYREFSKEEQLKKAHRH